MLWKAVSALRIVSCACASNGKRLRRGRLLREARRLRSGGAAHSSVLVAPDDSRGGGLGVGPVFVGAWLGHGGINGNLETDAGCDTRHSAFVDSALLPQAPGPHSVSVVKGLGHASLTVHAGRLPMA